MNLRQQYNISPPNLHNRSNIIFLLRKTALFGVVVSMVVLGIDCDLMQIYKVEVHVHAMVRHQRICCSQRKP